MMGLELHREPRLDNGQRGSIICAIGFCNRLRNRIVVSRNSRFREAIRRGRASCVFLEWPEVVATAVRNPPWRRSFRYEMSMCHEDHWGG